jgi:hypothetical protein
MLFTARSAAASAPAGGAEGHAVRTTVGQALRRCRLPTALRVVPGAMTLLTLVFTSGAGERNVTRFCAPPPRPYPCAGYPSQAARAAVLAPAASRHAALCGLDLPHRIGAGEASGVLGRGGAVPQRRSWLVLPASNVMRPPWWPRRTSGAVARRCTQDENHPQAREPPIAEPCGLEQPTRPAESLKGGRQ